MCCESVQMLSSSLRLAGCTDERLYKSTHVNHPSSKWVRKSCRHFLWLYEHTLELCRLYTLQTGKIHKSEVVARICFEHSYLLPDLGFQVCEEDLAVKNNEVGQAALAIYRQTEMTFEDAVEVYLNYYFAKKYVVDYMEKL